VLQIKVPGFETYRWSTGSLGNTVNISQSNLYILNVKDTNNCKGADSIYVLFKNCINLQMPNAFTPNADRTNDVFKPYVPAPVTDFQMRIWNKWGVLLFESYDYRKGWNGTYKGIAQAMDTYVYLVTLKDVDGIKVSKKGTFILIR
jgi:gliding motility-associated-like protein